MPVYNAGEILRNTIESIISQTFADWELLLIDDGSTDGSSKICDEYGSLDKRIKPFHKINGGICDARNFGIKHASGKYICFCDHDDLYEKNLLEKVSSSFDEYPCDAVSYRYNIITDNNKRESYDLEKDYGQYPIIFREFQNIICKLYYNSALQTVWSMAYRSDFIKSKELEFDLFFKFGGEDINFNLKLCKESPSIFFIPDILYNHYIRGGFSTSSKFHAENINLMLRHIEDLNSTILALKSNLNYISLDYFKVYMRLLKNSLSFAVLCGLNYSDFSRHVNALRGKNLLRIMNIRYQPSFFYALPSTEKVIFLLLKLKLDFLVYGIFKVSWKLK